MIRKCFYRGGLLAAAALAFTAACVKQKQTQAADGEMALWDYSDKSLWLALTETPAAGVDVFFAYPTTYTGDRLVTGGLDPDMAAGAREWLKDSASCMEGVGNFFAPYYRQANAVKLLSLPGDKRAPVLIHTSYRDLRTAFDYYIRNLNGGRPYILFGHSQGASDLVFLLADYMAEHQDVYRRMIAAYTIGVSVTGDNLKNYPYLKFAEGSDDTGVIISYNTEAPGVTSGPLVQPGAISINPVNWKLDGTPAPAEENAGSFIGGRKVMSYADAQTDPVRGVVVCTTVSPDDPQWALPAPFPYGSFHKGDIQFYYYNLRENAKLRAAKYLALAAAGKAADGNREKRE